MALQCAFPEDLDSATLAMLEDIGSRAAAIDQLIDQLAAETLSETDFLNSGLDVITNALSVGQNPNLRNEQDLTDVYGLEAFGSSMAQDEYTLFLAGIISVAGVLYASGDQSPNAADANNIEVLRRLYLAYGRDLTKVAAALASAAPVNLSETYKVQMVQPQSPSNPIVARYPKTLYQLRTELGANYLTNNEVGVMPDGKSWVLTYDYLAVNKSYDQLHVQYSLNESQILSNIIQFGGIQNSTAAINRWTAYGFDSFELSAILAEPQGSDLRDLSPNPLLEYANAAQAAASRAISSVDFLISRLGKVSIANQRKLLSAAVEQINTALGLQEFLIAKSRFKVALIQNTDTLARLREQHTDTEIKYLLEQRPEVQGIWFDAPDDVINRLMAQTTTSGSSQISNSYVNQSDSATFNLSTTLVGYGYLQEALKLSNILTSNLVIKRSDLESAKAALTAFVSLNPAQTPDTSGSIIQGQTSVGTAADAIMRRMDYNRTVKYEKKLNAIQQALNNLEKVFNSFIYRPLIAIINSLVRVINNANDVINKLVAKMRAQVLAFKQKLDSLLSKLLSLIGLGDFPGSILGSCLVFNFNFKLNFIDDLLNYINELADRVADIINKFLEIITKMIEELLCYPIQLLNEVLGKLDALKLPIACITSGFTLGDELENALKALRAAQIGRLGHFTSYSSNLVEYQSIVAFAPDKAGNFGQSSICGSQSLNNFLSASLKNITAGIGIGGAANTGGISKAFL